MQSEMMPSDAAILELLLERESAGVAELAEAMEVTATAVRQRLMRLMAHGYVQRSATKAGRGRPSHRYTLTHKGRRKTGVNFDDLAIALWREIGELQDVEVKRRLLSGISKRLAHMYGDVVRGESLQERLQSLAGLLHERRIPLSVDAEQREKVLTVLACPYPDLADQDRSVCAMERQVFTEVLGENVRLDRCRLDGDHYCQFAMSQPAADS